MCWFWRCTRIRRLVLTQGVQRLSNRSAIRQNTNFITKRERRFQSLVFYSDLASLSRNYFSGSADHSQPAPAIAIDRISVSFTHYTVGFE